MLEWFKSLSALEQVYLWLGLVATVFLVVQIIMMCFSTFGGDVDIDGDGDIDVDVDSGVSVFTVKSITAFFAIGGWAGLLTCTLANDGMQWLSVIIALIAGLAAMAVVVVLMRLILKLQCNGAVQTDKLIGERATVYVTVPAKRGGRGKITLNAQGRYMELDAVTESEEKLSVDQAVIITAVENECCVVKRLDGEEDQADDTVTVMNATNIL